MRRLAVLTVCLLVLVPVLDASAAGRKGTVGSSFVSRTSGGKHETSFKSSGVKKLYANFVWKTPAAAGQVLRIEWHDPKGDLRAVWEDKTVKEDKKGTRLYAWVGPGIVKGKLGTWTAMLLVGGTKISISKFKIVA